MKITIMTLIFLLTKKSISQNKLNENFEITSNGMIRLRNKKIQKGETAYLKSRIKETCKNIDLNDRNSNHSSSVGSLPQLNSGSRIPNILMQNQLLSSNPISLINTRQNCMNRPVSIFDEIKNCPSPTFKNSKYKNSELESSNRADSNMWRNMIPENPNCIDMKRSFLRDKDSRLNKIIMRGGLTSSSSSTAQLYENKEKANQLSSQIKLNYYRTSTSPLDMQAKKLIKPGDMVTVNIGGVPFISGLNSSGNERQSAYANQNPKQDIRDNLIQRYKISIYSTM